MFCHGVFVPHLRLAMKVEVKRWVLVSLIVVCMTLILSSASVIAGETGSSNITSTGHVPGGPLGYTPMVIHPSATFTIYHNYTYTGTVQQWTIPSGVKEINVTLAGAAGNSTTFPGNSKVSGGPGANFTTPILTTGLSTIYIFVGGMNGWDGGGSGGTSPAGTGDYGGNGGGQSLICTGGATCNMSQADVIADAAGGGGAGGSTSYHTTGGGAGGAAGGGGPPLAAGPAAGNGAGGSGGPAPGNGGLGAGPGNAGAGGTGVGNSLAGGNGGVLYGGTGSNGTSGPGGGDGGGGGGGGGYYGGGAGSAGGNSYDAGGGGGGGSSFVRAAAVPTGMHPVVTANNTKEGYISIEFTANDNLVANAPTPAGLAIDSGQSVTLHSNVVGGVGAIAFQWYSISNLTGNPACTSGVLVGTTASITSSPLTTNTSFCYVANDSIGANSASAWDSVAVNPALVANPVTPSNPVFDSSQNVTLVSHAKGGTPGFAYQWFNSSSNGSACNAGTSITGGNKTSVNVSKSGFYCYEVTDSSSAGPVSVGSTWDFVVVNGPLLANPITPGSPTIDQGQSLVLHSSASGGTAPLSYLWESSISNSTPCSSGTPSGTSQNATVSPSANTYYCYIVNDSSPAGSVSVSSLWDMVTVNPPLVAGPITPALPNITAGSSLTLTAHPSGGTVAYAYQWYAGTSATCSQDPAISGANAATYSATPSANTYYCYSVIDSSQGTPSANVTSSSDLVSVKGVVLPLSITSFAATPNPVQVNATITIATVATGGVTPYSYSYGGLPSGCTSQNAATWSCAPHSPGTFTLSVTVTDKQGKAANDTLKLTVNPAAAGSPVIASFTATPASINLGSSSTIAVKATGGTPPYSYAYAGLPPGCSAGKVAQFTCTPTSPGNFSISVTVTDSTAKSVSSSALLTVTGQATPLVVSLKSNASSISLGGTITLTATLKGGVGPFQYVWSVNGANSTTNQNLSWVYRPSSAGNYRFVLWVKDARGVTVGSNAVNLTVTSGSTTSSPSSSWLSNNYWLIILLIVILGLLLLLLYWRSRHSNKPTPVSEGATSAEVAGEAGGAAVVAGSATPEWSEEGIAETHTEGSAPSEPSDASGEEPAITPEPAAGEEAESTPRDESGSSGPSESEAASEDSPAPEEGPSGEPPAEPAPESSDTDDAEPAPAEDASEDDTEEPSDPEGEEDPSTPPSENEDDKE